MNPTIAKKSRAHLLLVATFAIFIGLPGIFALFQFPGTVTSDPHRVLAPFPALTRGQENFFGMIAFAKQLENYFNDHFSGRNLLVAGNLSLKRVCFPYDLGPNVLRGKAGWCFYTGDEALEDYTGLTPFTQQDLASWQSRLELRRDWLAARGIPYVFILAPSKETIYPEYLPERIKRGTTTRTDQLVEFLRQHSTVRLIDLRAPIRSAKSWHELYYQTDSHWNLAAGLVASQIVISNLTPLVPGLRLLALQDFPIVRMYSTPGDLARMAGVNYLEEANVFRYPKDFHSIPLQFQEGTSAPDLANFSALPLNVPTALQIRSAATTKGVIVFGDSFFLSMAPFWGTAFSQTFFYDCQFDPRTVEREKPVLVVNEIVERSLGHQPRSIEPALATKP